MRRCNYVDGSYPVAMTNPKNPQANTNPWPLRLPYERNAEAKTLNIPLYMLFVLEKELEAES